MADPALNLVRFQSQLQNLLTENTPESLSAAVEFIDSTIANRALDDTGLQTAVKLRGGILTKARQSQQLQKLARNTAGTPRSLAQTVDLQRRPPLEAGLDAPTAPVQFPALQGFEAPQSLIPEGGRFAGGIISSEVDPETGQPAFARGIVEQAPAPEDQQADLARGVTARIAKLKAAGFSDKLIELVFEQSGTSAGAETTEFEKARQRTLGKEQANREIPLGQNAAQWFNPSTFESATPDINQIQATAQGLRPLRKGVNPQFVTAARSAKGILDQLDELVPRLFVEGGLGGRIVSFGSLQAAFLQGEPDAVKFFSLIASTRGLFARAGGDVGNISVVEQAFQAFALPNSRDNLTSALAKLESKRQLLNDIVSNALGLPSKTFKDAITQEATEGIKVDFDEFSEEELRGDPEDVGEGGRFLD